LLNKFIFNINLICVGLIDIYDGNLKNKFFYTTSHIPQNKIQTINNKIKML